MRDRRNASLSISSTDSSNSIISWPSRNAFNEKHYSDLAPPAPSLPGPATKGNRSRYSYRRVTIMRTLLATVCALLFTWRYILGWPLTSHNAASTPIPSTKIASPGLAAGNDLPNEPVALLVTHGQASSRWTIAIPHNATFPLRQHWYRDLCTTGTGLQRTIAQDARRNIGRHWWREQSQAAHDETFLDIRDAEEMGALPPPKPEDIASNVCDKSLTFVLESKEASFGKSLLLLWLSYGLAKKEGRAFFVDDTRWAWGKYTSYFAAPPIAKCKQPPAHYIVPCPRSARHIVVSSATSAWTFGEKFQKEFHVARKHGVEAQSRLYDLAHTGFKALFRLTGEDSLYAASRTAKLQDDAASRDGFMIGMQIRRGDRHPFEYQYSRDYLPLERYSRGARLLSQKLLNGHHAPEDHSAPPKHAKSSLVLSTDDPDILESYELLQAAAPFSVQSAQERIQLATKSRLDKTSPVAPQRDGAYTKHIDENIGWEGGFYSALFFSLGGASRASNSNSNASIPDQALRLRQLVGRAYLLDLAVLSKSDGVVCAISSASCRALGVMMGWNAVRDGRWMNVDDGRSWSWNGQR